MNDEFGKLDVTTKAAVERAIAECKTSGERVRRPHGVDGEVYAYPHGSGGIAWGYNGPPQGFNIARGVRRR
jgi:hypothetical protein